MDTGFSTWRPLAALGGFVVACMAATTTITVERGETLGEIAAIHGVTVADLVAWNGLDDPDHILEGARLVVARPAGEDVRTAHPGRYTVVPGDTLSSIAGRFGVSVAGLVDTNGLENPDRIIAGTTLRLAADANRAGTTGDRSGPGGPDTYTVQAGDSLSTIAEQFGVSTTALARANGVVDRDLIRVGQVLRIAAPTSDQPATQSAPSNPTPGPTAAPAPAPGAGAAPSSGGGQPLSNLFVRWSDAYAVPRDLLEALLWKTSDWRADLVGPDGHLGIGQLNPETVEFVETRLLGRDMDPLDADDGIQMAARLLRFLLDRTHSDHDALAAWRQGVSGVQDNGVSATAAAFADEVLEIRRQRA